MFLTAATGPEEAANILGRSTACFCFTAFVSACGGCKHIYPFIQSSIHSYNSNSIQFNSFHFISFSFSFSFHFHFHFHFISFNFIPFHSIHFISFHFIFIFFSFRFIFILFHFISIHSFIHCLCFLLFHYVISPLSNSPRIPLSKQVPIAYSHVLFWKLPHGACRALPGTTVKPLS